MRTSIALAVSVLLTLAACGSDESADEGTSAPAETTASESAEPTDAEDTSEPTDTDSIAPASYECTDPLAGNPTEVSTHDLIVCTTLTLADAEGYATQSTMTGSGTTTLRVNTDPFTVEVTYSDGVIVVANSEGAWVKEEGGKWQKGDATSEDFLIAQATQVLPTYRNAQNPAITTAQIPEGTTYQVEGKETIDGEEYTILTGTFDQEGTSTELRMWISDDYQQLKSVSTSTYEGADPVEITTEYLEWDVAQDIEIPEN
ncbi:hypothetical protein [Flaviflexus massiliensis]|uniref:hypothetical protein n=1 Tax=Flaviflexus massiliensis TaxID=1522309 RepID=UPI0006D53AAA|nr:hypothetical protein [Flaviflexus massiliensis]